MTETMRKIIKYSAWLLLGICIGWYLGYYLPFASNQRQLLKEYEWVKKNLDMNDPGLAETIRLLPKDFQDQIYMAQKNEDEMLAVVGLATFRSLEKGDIPAAKHLMLQRIGSYYRLYHENGGNPDTLAKIEEAASKYAAIATKISQDK